MTERQIWLSLYLKARDYHTQHEGARKEADEAFERIKELSNHE